MNGVISYQPVRGHLVRTTRYNSADNSNSDDDHAPRATSSSSGRAFARREEARTYVFGNDDGEEELCRSDVELVWKGKPSEHRHSLVTFAEAPVRTGDTLVAIALRYGCKVGELKRLNRLIQDQDVFSLRTIRIPVKRYGMVEELIRMEMAQEEAKLNIGGVAEVSADETDNEDFMSDDDDDRSATGSDRRPLLPLTHDLSALSTQGKQAVRYLHGVDDDIRTVVTSFASTILTNGGGDNAPVAIPRKRHSSVSLLGVDCGLRWSTIAIGAVIVLIVVPCALYFLLKLHDGEGKRKP